MMNINHDPNSFSLFHFPTLPFSHFRSCHYKEYYISSTFFFMETCPFKERTQSWSQQWVERNLPSKNLSHFPTFPLIFPLSKDACPCGQCGVGGQVVPCPGCVFSRVRACGERRKKGRVAHRSAQQHRCVCVCVCVCA